VGKFYDLILDPHKFAHQSSLLTLTHSYINQFRWAKFLDAIVNEEIIFFAHPTKTLTQAHTSATTTSPESAVAPQHPHNTPDSYIPITTDSLADTGLITLPVPHVNCQSWPILRYSIIICLNFSAQV
jgi:hypothetical protein